MVISPKIVIGKSIAHNADKIVAAIKEKKTCSYPVWYGITTAFEKENLMYILSGVEMRHSEYIDSDLILLGIAGSRKEANEIVLNLVQDGYNKGNIHCMKQYLEELE